MLAILYSTELTQILTHVQHMKYNLLSCSTQIMTRVTCSIQNMASMQHEKSDSRVAIDNKRTLLDWKLLSAIVTIRVSCPIMMEDLREDYESVLQDILTQRNQKSIPSTVK